MAGCSSKQLFRRAAVHCFTHRQVLTEAVRAAGHSDDLPGFAAFGTENSFSVAAVGADMYRHVFQYAENRNIDFVEHIDCLVRVNQGNVLRRGNDDRTGYRGFFAPGVSWMSPVPGGRSMKR